ncbi:MAG: elongation factor P [Candidatus Liptonbacteria bacterium]|nr:elongation factor P [Candidatus Liptonbacteria bacterium]
MLSYTDLKKGVLFVYEGQPYEVIESSFLRMQQRKAVVQTKIRNLVSGKILDRNWQASDEFEEAEVERKEALFIYKKSVRSTEGGEECWFHEIGNPKERFSLASEVIGEQAQFLKPNTTVNTVLFNGKVIKVSLPIKMDFEVIEAPPGVRGNTAQGGTKTVVIEGGATVQAPLFINQGDVIRINTETGEYVERVEKA